MNFEVKLPIQEINLEKKLDIDTYEKELKIKQKKLRKLQKELRARKIPLIIAFEGWDAAGKGGAIKRLTQKLDPRGYDVYSISAPNEEELSKHYLWRFWAKMPSAGHVAIFDRSWYGRMMVERVEKLCEPKDWGRAYTEINDMEYTLAANGAILMKFWIQVDKDTQLSRFKDRQNTPKKRWKLTDEDWRNRSKWEEYEEAVNEMIALTHTDNAPWVIIEGNDKLYARIKVIAAVIQTIEDIVEHKQEDK